MLKIPSITDAEWHIMKVLWERPQEWLTAAEIVEPVARERSIHHRTARTLLARLARKRAVETRKAESGPGYLYHARVARDAAIRAQSRSFLSRIFDGNAAPAIVHLLKESRLSPGELQELRTLLNDKEKS